MNPEKTLLMHFESHPKLGDIVLKHSKEVANLSLEIAKKLDRKIDLTFLKEAALLHDIGVSLVKTPESIDSKHDYIHHGYLGREILEKEGLPRHAPVAERHVGSGITKNAAKKLGLPERDMLPRNLEEKSICFADKFSSKSPGKKDDIESIEKEMIGYGDGSFGRFRELRKLFGY